VPSVISTSDYRQKYSVGKSVIIKRISGSVWTFNTKEILIIIK